MEKPPGYKSTYPARPGRVSMRNYLVYINGTLYGETMAVYPEKSANNVRWQMYEECGDWRKVPAIEDFDCVEKK